MQLAKQHSGYKQTEVGVIPADWDVKLLPEVCRFRGGKAHEQYVSDLGRYVVVNSKFISSDGFVRKYSTANFCCAKRNDVLMVMSDLPNGKALAKAFIADADDLYAVNQRVCTLTAYRDSARYLYYVLNRNSYFLKFDDGVNQTHLLNPVFKKCKIPLPPTLAEQEAIAAALSDADGLIESLEALIAKKRQIKQGTMQELLTGNRRLPGFSGEWETKRLGEIFEISAGGDLDKAYFSPFQTALYCHPIFANSVMAAGLYGYTSVPRYDADAITVTARGTLGIANHRPMKFDAIGRLLILKPRTRTDCRFVAEFINNQINFAIESTGVPQLTAPQISQYSVSYPQFDEQQSIAAVLLDMDAEVAALEAKLAKAQQIKQGMMQELLTGRTRLI